MSTNELNVKPHKPYRVQLTPAEKQAMIAAIASGRRKSDVAKDYGILPQSLSRMIRDVKKVAKSSNPLNGDWKSSILPSAQAAVERGLSHDDDPIGAMNGAIKLLHGLGYLVSGSHLQVDANVAMQVAWMPMQSGDISESDTRVIDVTPSESTDAT